LDFKSLQGVIILSEDLALCAQAKTSQIIVNALFSVCVNLFLREFLERIKGFSFELWSICFFDFSVCNSSEIRVIILRNIRLDDCARFHTLWLLIRGCCCLCCCSRGIEVIQVRWSGSLSRIWVRRSIRRYPVRWSVWGLTRGRISGYGLDWNVGTILRRCVWRRRIWSCVRRRSGVRIRCWSWGLVRRSECCTIGGYSRWHSWQLLRFIRLVWSIRWLVAVLTHREESVFWIIKSRSLFLFSLNYITLLWLNSPSFEFISEFFLFISEVSTFFTPFPWNFIKTNKNTHLEKQTIILIQILPHTNKISQIAGSFESSIQKKKKRYWTFFLEIFHIFLQYFESISTCVLFKLLDEQEVTVLSALVCLF